MKMLLNKQEMIDLGEDLRGFRIHCCAGICWLTQSGDGRDHILRSGSSFTVHRRGQLIITATEASQVMLIGPEIKNQPSRLVKSLYGRFNRCSTANLQ